jgi:hypothetical protein
LRANGSKAHWAWEIRSRKDGNSSGDDPTHSFTDAQWKASYGRTRPRATYAASAISTSSQSMPHSVRIVGHGCTRTCVESCWIADITFV